MNGFIQVVITALAALTVENLLFSGGMGFSNALRAARHPKIIGMYSLLVTLFSLVSILVGSALNPLIPGSETLIFLRPSLYAFCAAAAYLIATFSVKLFFPGFYRKYGELLAPAAMNTVVLAMPYVQKAFKLSVLEALGYALGTGIAFFLAAMILAGAVTRQNKDMPKAFAGLPSMLIYIGILSLAFAGFTGAKLF